MALSRKNERNLKRLRKEADRLWAEQKSVNEHAKALLASAGSEAKTLRDSELYPAIRRSYDSNVRPSLDRGFAIARDAADDARVRFNGRVIPAVATVGGSVAGALSQLATDDRDFKQVAKRAKGFSKDLDKRARKAAKEYDRKYNSGGIGVGGWFLIGAGVAAVAAVGYALWQTFRADDDLWIADEDLDAPVTTVTPHTAA
ncbi:DNA/RNA helicase [Pseudoclavibacter chungangensis]|uniref:DNA/RNA helicase n=1 Tax=Pseudoclavibacter chungangensis TaxID=587635 RepID=A0A7J5BPR5_9MICO|nr:DNA/RNA helicase [Pseudoclavibacter chungangensis]KAB1655348.1 DNA/RNA helicase [Pseudoclavibacter chungangensis]NYJ68298.1 hypothetical protein [Pseudoclavibacter chungangensis]